MTDRPVASARYIVGHVLEVLRAMPAASVDLVLSSPPFLGLRSYLPDDDPAKAEEMGSEDTPAEYIDGLLDVVEECRRVLTPHGSIAFELGDTYAGSGGAGGDYKDDGLRSGQQKFSGTAAKARRRGDGEVRARTHRRSRRRDQAIGILPAGRDAGGGEGWPADKSLCLIPEAFRLSLVYGYNVLSGPRRVVGVDDYGNTIEVGRDTPQWRARNVIRWCRPNPSVGALGDKVRPGTSDMVIACVDRRRYFDLDSIREPFKGKPGVGTGVRKGQGGGKPEDDRPDDMATRVMTHDGGPPLDHWWADPDDDDVFEEDAWLVSTEAYPGSHYATWPKKLLERPIKAMCPLRVCTTCGAASERIVEVDHEPNRNTNGPQSIDRAHVEGGSPGFKTRADRIARTVGWTDCGHGTWRAGVVLDPFAGSGTTLAVAFGHGRSSVGIDLDKRNVSLAMQRVGMWLVTETFEGGDRK